MTRQHKGDLGATPADVRAWNSIEWKHIRKNVERLQVRIAKAAKEERWNKVRVLQRILVTSWSAKALAVKTVTSNKGKSTPGVDGVIWKTAKAKLQAISSLKRKGYRAKPLRRTYIPKSNGKMRPLGIPTMSDRAMQALFTMALLPLAETQGDQHSYGFRPRRSVADAIEQCFIALACGNRAQWILEGDIKACFDQISHRWMLDHIPMDKSVLRQWLKAGYLEKDVLHQTEEGTPQGGIASPVLANMALDGLQAAIAEAAPKGSKVNFIRYADDFICTGISGELLEDTIKPTIVAFMDERGLSLSEEKTLITKIDSGFDFLGFNIRKYNGKLLCKPSKKKVQAFLQRLKGCVGKLRFEKTYRVISALNRALRGWSNFYRQGCSSKVFSTIDHALFRYLWSELKRRHPKKNARWIRRTYFRSRGSNRWLFFGDEVQETRRRTHTLLNLASVSIRRHVKVRSKANPYDPADRPYFHRRAAIKTAIRRRDKARSSVTITPWERCLKGQLELFPAGLPT